MKTLKTVGMVTLLGVVFAMSSTAHAKKERTNGRGTGPVVYVTSQALFYDSIVVVDSLPMKGPFQKLEMDGPSGLQTEFGPGDYGHRGGRWWVDANMNMVMDEEDVFFLCPLLGPGRETLNR